MNEEEEILEASKVQDHLYKEEVEEKPSSSSSSSDEEQSEEEDEENMQDILDKYEKDLTKSAMSKQSKLPGDQKIFKK